MHSNIKDIDVGIDFTRFPAGRYLTDGKFSGQRFREQYLIPALGSFAKLRIILDGTMGYGSSFLEEAFGGLVREEFDRDELLSRLILVSEDGSLVDEIKEYIATA